MGVAGGSDHGWALLSQSTPGVTSTRSRKHSVFELLKYQHGPPEGTKADALQVGSRRLRAPLSDHPDLLDGDSDDADSLAVEDAESSSASDDEDDDENLSVADRIFKDRGRSKEEAEKRLGNRLDAIELALKNYSEKHR